MPGSVVGGGGDGWRGAREETEGEGEEPEGEEFREYGRVGSM
jgi:hypothetical protein